MVNPIKKFPPLFLLPSHCTEYSMKVQTKYSVNSKIKLFQKNPMCNMLLYVLIYPSYFIKLNFFPHTILWYISCSSTESIEAQIKLAERYIIHNFIRERKKEDQQQLSKMPNKTKSTMNKENRKGIQNKLLVLVKYSIELAFRKRIKSHWFYISHINKTRKKWLINDIKEVLLWFWKSTTLHFWAHPFSNNYYFCSVDTDFELYFFPYFSNKFHIQAKGTNTK